LRIRRASARDLEALLALEHDAFAGDRLSRRQVRRHLQGASARLVVATRGRRIAGYALVFFRRASAVARLYSIAVAASERGAGIGARLLEACERLARRRGARELRLEVRVRNAAARRLYERAGFHPFGLHPGYYEDGADAVRYRKALAPPARR
jgi:ribosomal-protein-alanine acetyltransferase